MAKKVRCPGCGAKNDVGRHRCRVCTAVVDPTAAEGLPKGLAKQRKQQAVMEDARARNAREFSADDLEQPHRPGPDAPPVIGPSYGPVVAEPVNAPLSGPEVPVPEGEPGGLGLADEAIVIDAAPRHIESPLVPISTEGADESAPWDAVAGIEIDAVGRHGTDVPPPIEHVDEVFDPNALVIDPPH